MPGILITGANGQLGKALRIALREHVLFPTDLADLDISNLDAVVESVGRLNPDIVINCAAFTAVDRCESEIDQAYKINAIGARNCAIASEKQGAKIVHISTDYVFDGKGIIGSDGNVRPYNEFDTTNPVNIYGNSKLAGERFVQMYNPRHFVLRTAWLYGDGGNFVNTMLQLSRREDAIRVVDDQVGSPTSTHELAGVIQRLMLSENYGLFHAASEGMCSWFEFAREIFKCKGITREVAPVSTDMFPRPAKRPSYSALDAMMLRMTLNYSMSHWRDALGRYLEGVD